ncbi:FHA domain-containing protein [Lysobacter niastensis]|uniref:FHA domain-containing protein n=1 Tax=Lysobacter niastensis TaxID=380629 RepID=A0ABS0B757_9GAMM|nr:FHA domain-containing protein [Lysobacter niastensis]
MLDCRGVEALRLRFQNRPHADLALSPGVHALGIDRSGDAVLVHELDEAVAQLCVDRRGVWLQVRAGVRGLHVNGRPVRRMAMLRVGDAIYVNGVELMLLGNEPLPVPRSTAQGNSEARMVLRGVGGLHHGRAYSLDQPRVVGRAADCDIRINEPAFAEHHARLEPHADGVVLRDAGSADGSLVNGVAVRDALLRPGDQVVFDLQHRFVIEAPVGRATTSHASGVVRPDPVVSDTRDEGTRPLPRPMRRMPWLLLAALLMAAVLSLLLLYGAR